MNHSQITCSAPQCEVPVVHATSCQRCGACVEQDQRYCPNCGAEQAIAAEARPSAVPLPRYFRCENCGAEVAVDPDQRSYRCAFCDSTYVVQFSPEQTGRQPPEFVIGFAVTPEEALEKFRTWLGRRALFCPGDLHTAQVEDKLKGVYVPFWSFSMLARSRWSALIGEHWQRTETYTTVVGGKTVVKTRTVTETEWWPLSGRHHSYYSGYLVSGSRGLPQRWAERIMPFHLAGLKRYEPFYLAGWLAEEYSIGRDAALRATQQEFLAREQAACAAFLPGDTHRNLQVETTFEHVNSDLILLPVYLLSYRYRNRVYRFLVNGQTGKVAGERPLSVWRILAAVAAVLALVATVALIVARG